jgi:hypothetical protein
MDQRVDIEGFTMTGAEYYGACSSNFSLSVSSCRLNSPSSVRAATRHRKCRRLSQPDNQKLARPTVEALPEVLFSRNNGSRLTIHPF